MLFGILPFPVLCYVAFMRELLSPTENSAPSLPETSGNLCASLCNRGGEKNRLLINLDYNIDDYVSITKFPKIDFNLFIYSFFI